MRADLIRNDLTTEWQERGASEGTQFTILGRIVGSWKRVIEKDPVLLTFRPFTTLTEAEDQAVAQAVEGYSTFLGKPVILA